MEEEEDDNEKKYEILMFNDKEEEESWNNIKSSNQMELVDDYLKSEIVWNKLEEDIKKENELESNENGKTNQIHI